MSKEKSGNWFARHKFLTGLAAIIVLVVAVSVANGGNDATKVDSTSDSSSDQAQEQTTFKVGDKISFDNKVVTVTSVKRNWHSGNEFITPDSGNEFVKVAITIKNDSDDQVSYNTFDWKVQTKDGVIKDVDSMAFSVDGALNSGELAPKGTVKGFLVFQVPAGEEFTLQYSPSFWTDKKLEIKV